MSTLVAEITDYIRNFVQGSLATRDGVVAELRAELHGPPLEYLEQVFSCLVEGEGLQVTGPSGERVNIPIVLQVERLDAGTGDPAINGSGKCLAPHVLAKRNSPDCPRYVALVPPGAQSVMSRATASKDFGLSKRNSSGGATIEEWWTDDFIQALVHAALLRGKLASDDQEEAARLVRQAIFSADEVDRHDLARRKSWRVLSRIFSISDLGLPFGTQLSLACGFPPSADGKVHYETQGKVLRDIADALGGAFGAGVRQLKEEATEQDSIALDGFLEHLEQACEIPTAFEGAATYYYAPGQDSELPAAPPLWWTHLTTDRWIELLKEEPEVLEALGIECRNSIIPIRKGMPALVLGPVELKVARPQSPGDGADVTVSLESGPSATRRTWTLAAAEDEVVDPAPPLHRAPVRYAATSENLKKATAKVISLEQWEPAVFAYCQTAQKLTPPKKTKVGRGGPSFEASLSVTGLGRHYIDLYVRGGTLISGISIVAGADGVEESESARVTQVSEHAFGFEVDVPGECHCDVRFDRGNGEELLRLEIQSEEAEVVGCASEFERLIGLNRSRVGGRVANEVEVNRQHRCTDLQGWMLDPRWVDKSYRPIVLGPDYANEWGAPGWDSAADTILSSGKFLLDPRPTFDAMQPPPAFLTARKTIAERIRALEGNGLVEAAKLGAWLHQEGTNGDERSFAEELDQYLASYLAWLETAPEQAAWVDVILVASFERDKRTLVQDPDAVILSPLHPLKLAWQGLAQRTLYQSYRAGMPCAAASILDAGRVPDVLVLPMRTAAGSTKNQPFVSVECSSDYWSVLWNGSRLGLRADRLGAAPFDGEFGLQVGGASSGFSVAQVKRALDDVTGMLGAKPVINVAVSSAAGTSSACDAGLLEWSLDHFGNRDDGEAMYTSLGPRLLQVFDDRPAPARPDDSALANLAEDTSNAVRWFRGQAQGAKPDLGIIAQLESAQPEIAATELRSPVGSGSLIRHRVRQQLPGANQAFLVESRMALGGPPSGDGFADKVMACVVKLENLGSEHLGYTFAPSVHAIEDMLKDKQADFVAVSSSAVDPACFLGGWLGDAYLWDYHLPSYSQRAGDTNGYYLLSQVKTIDRQTLKKVLARLPGGKELGDEVAIGLLHEVASRGIPTVRGLSGGDAGATGDLGLFISARLLQDEFRPTPGDPGLLPVMSGNEEVQHVAMVIPVDPFRGYLDDLQRSLGRTPGQRPDFVAIGVDITDSSIKCKLTPIEVKYRNGVSMSVAQRKDALEQARALSALLKDIKTQADNPDLSMWRLAFQHLLNSMLGYGFRVYSQQRLAHERSRVWSMHHQRVVAAILSDEMDLCIDEVGRLVTVDGSPSTGAIDVDGDGFRETITVNPRDAAAILFGEPAGLYASIRDQLGDWSLMPRTAAVRTLQVTGQPAEQAGVEHGIVGQTSLGNAAEGQGSSSSSSRPPVVGSGSLPLATEDPNPPPPSPEAASEPPAPDLASSGLEIQVGITVDEFQEKQRYLNLSTTKLNQLNIGVVGDLGTGKTQFLKSLIYQVSAGKVANNGVRPRFLIFDYKKDYSSQDFVEATQARVQSPANLPLNLFDISDAAGDRNAWLRRFQFFSDVLDKIYSGIGPVQRSNLKKAVKAAYDTCGSAGRQPTIYDVHAQYEIILDGKVDSIFSILDDLVDMELFAREPADAGAFSRFFDGVVVIQLSELGQDDRTKNMLVAVMLNMFYEHMLTIPKRPFRGIDPQLRVIDSFLLVDEADNILQYEFDVLRKVLLQGREFGVGVILASQFLRHFKTGGTDYREPLLTWFVHKVPNVTAQELGALGLTADLADLANRVKLLPNHHCLFKTFDVAGEVLHGMPYYKLREQKK